jgi:hypothetical protein
MALDESRDPFPLWKLIVRFSLLHEFEADLHYKKAIKELRTFVLDTPRSLPTFMAAWQEKVKLIARTYDLLNPTIPKEHQIRFLTDQQEAVLFITNCGKSFQPLLAAIELSSLTMAVAMKRVRQVVHVNPELQVETLVVAAAVVLPCFRLAFLSTCKYAESCRFNHETSVMEDFKRDPEFARKRAQFIAREQFMAREPDAARQHKEQEAARKHKRPKFQPKRPVNVMVAAVQQPARGAKHCLYCEANKLPGHAEHNQWECRANKT